MTQRRVTTDSLISEREWQETVIELARACGWMVYHTHDSRRSAAGWPDLAIAGHGRLILAELKTERGRMRPEQREWLAVLTQCAGVEVCVWRPSDWSEVVEALNVRTNGTTTE